ncbi:hypothetical protein SAMN05421676_102338 [Salinibacillus kushneri]|uniref:Uncharacterized protein n=1 Tax=Salinibacillus kushneri TaxID=237682 RepID=A0A1I0B4V9_9BACI|nr:hypothetical protein [Salinibacillus kushneri]SET01143.1 hypothetical protein SAMN05421676_102338 [Salinibacillus kushneri]
MSKEYAVYRGEEVICIGTEQECAAKMGIKLLSFRHYTMPSYKKLRAKAKNPDKWIMVINLDDED